MEIVVAEMIKRFRKEKGLTTKQLGRIIGVSDSAISLYETGERTPPVLACVRLAAAFDCSLDFLIHGKEKDRLAGRSREELLKMFDSMTEGELEYLGALLQAALADKRFQAHLRQGVQEEQ